MNRREFLRLSGYGCLLAAGGALSGCTIEPLSMLMGDPERPLPAHARAVWRTGLCTLCPGGCGIRTRIVEGHAVGLRGNPFHPISRGALCPRGAAGLEALYHPDRLSAPVRRAEGAETSISWDDGLAMAAEKIRNAVAANQGVAVVHGSPAELETAFLRRFLRAFGSSSEADLRTFRTARALEPFAQTQGVERAVHFDLARADYILSFDPGLLETAWSAVETARAYAEFRRGRPDRRGRFVVASARRTITAMNADEWLPVRPGFEGALALGIAAVLIKEERYDASAVAETVQGWTEFRRLVLREYGLSAVARMTGVPEATITRTARELSSARAPVVVSPLEVHILAPYAVTQIHALNALLGRIDRPGGVLVGRSDERIELAPPVPANAAPDDTSRESLVERILAGLPIGVLLIHEANPIADLPDGDRWEEAIRAVPFVIATSPRRNETSIRAHLHLPDVSYLEQWNLHAGATSEGCPVWSVGEPLLAPVGGRPLGATLISIARAVGGRVAGAFPWADPAQAVTAYAEALHANLGQGLIFGPEVEEMWSRLLERSGWRSAPRGDFQKFQRDWIPAGGWWDPLYPHGERRRVLAHPDHRFHLVVDSEAPLAIKPEGEAHEYPLLLIPHRPAVLSGGGDPGLPALRALIAHHGWPVGETFVELHPEDAAGIASGDAVRIVTPNGEVPAVAKVTDGVARGSAAVLVGLGRTAGGRWEVGYGSNPIRLFDRNLFGRGDGILARARIERA